MLDYILVLPRLHQTGRRTKAPYPAADPPGFTNLKFTYPRVSDNNGKTIPGSEDTRRRGLLSVRLAGGTAALFLSILLVAPAYAHAGFFSELFKFFAQASLGVDKNDLIQEIEAASYIAPILSAIPNPESAGDPKVPDLNVVQESALMAPANPLGTVQDHPDQDRIFIYIVKPGDTPSAIAKTFNVSVNTIAWANQLKSASAIQVGDQLLILPVSGVKHVVKKGDTIDSIAQKYKGDSSEILAFNGLAAGAALVAGDEIVIPDGELYSEAAPSPAASQRYAALPSLAGYFQRPIDGGRKSQGIHGRNGVDLATSCGSPIFAAADGRVLTARGTGWNGGFGVFLVIDHPNGTQTLYAHNSRNLVSAGGQVSRGQIIGLIGNTGNTRGATGCHVHFEVHGARNPF
ncbi:MAG: Peptidase M23 family protein [Parcubacteria group bacterium GW2011_GWB1_52_7]|nr:MAG: Peptidase M23 family protein [Parcubacteria group bacterium GW2011_GWA1_51_12]KKW28708.1 MAG: Peptidase M23 family protein [Parcubacteria group bacterium GW2011_GWB1_52_7]